MVVRGEEGQRGAKRGAHVAVVRGRDKHRGQGTAGERLAPSPRGQERRARHRAVLLVVLRDVVARQLGRRRRRDRDRSPEVEREGRREGCDAEHGAGVTGPDRKSTRMNSSHGYISYAVFCLKKKKKKEAQPENDKRPREYATYAQYTE